MSDTPVGHRHVLFPLTPDDDGYPPVSAERVWAIQRTHTSYELCSIPFFIDHVTLGDLIEVEERDGTFWFVRLITPSTNSLLRIVYYDTTSGETLCEQLRQLGCDIEQIATFHLISVSVPGTVPLAPIQAYVASGFHQNLLDYEEPLLRHAA